MALLRASTCSQSELGIEPRTVWLVHCSPDGATVLHVPTCVEDGGGQWRRCGLVQDQFPHQHPGGPSREAPLQEPHPEEIEVAMETERDHCDVARAAPVYRDPARRPLVDQVPSGEQAAVQSHVGGPREATDVSQEGLPHYVTEPGR